MSEMSSTQPSRPDRVRHEAIVSLDRLHRSQFGQFMTPNAIADFMASLFSNWPTRIRLLDPGAGLGSLVEAFVEQFLKSAGTGSHLVVDCFEIEPALVPHLQTHLDDVAVLA